MHCKQHEITLISHKTCPTQSNNPCLGWTGL